MSSMAYLDDVGDAEVEAGIADLAGSGLRESEVRGHKTALADRAGLVHADGVNDLPVLGLSKRDGRHIAASRAVAAGFGGGL